MQVQLTMVSGNAKTGPIPVSMTERASCPKTCAFYDKGCYAKYGPLGMHWQKVPERGLSWANFVQAIARMPLGQLWRHNQAGDLPGKCGRINLKQLIALVKANKGKNGYTYTHKPLTKDNRKAIKLANRQGFIVNLSADNLEHADKLAKLNIAPVCVVLPIDAAQGVQYVTPKGRKIITCPAAKDNAKDDMTCMRCKLCAKGDRKAIIGFPSHGTAKRSVNELVSKQ